MRPNKNLLEISRKTMDSVRRSFLAELKPELDSIWDAAFEKKPSRKMSDSRRAFDMRAPVMKPTTQFLTQNEIAREAGIPVSRLTAAIEAGLITPSGRAGSHKHSPVIFSREDLPRLKDALLGGISIKACAHGNPHQCKSAADVRAKHGAIIRAAREAGK